MQLLLTKFHLYCKNVVLQITNMHTGEIIQKGATQSRKCAKEQEKPTYLNLPGSNTNEDVAQKQTGGSRSQPGPSQPSSGARPLISTAQARLPLAVQ